MRRSANKFCVGELEYFRAVREDFDAPAEKMTFVERNASDVDVTRWAAAISSEYKPGHIKTLRKAEDIVRGVFGSLGGYQDMTADIPVAKRNIVEKHALCNFRDLEFSKNHDTSALQHEAELLVELCLGGSIQC